jgi:hypothetical protein
MPRVLWLGPCLHQRFSSGGRDRRLLVRNDNRVGIPGAEPDYVIRDACGTTSGLWRRVQLGSLDVPRYPIRPMVPRRGHGATGVAVAVEYYEELAVPFALRCPAGASCQV